MAPVEKGQVLGGVQLKLGDRVIGEYNLISEKAVEKTTLGHIMLRLLRSITKSA